MYCPKCGAAEQLTDTYCRKCGTFLPDFEKVRKKEITAEEHIKINSFFSIATAVISLSLAITLFVMFIGRDGTPWIIYLVFAFMMTITAWQIQTFIRTRMLKKQFEKLRPKRDIEGEREVIPKAEVNLLEEADLDDAIPASVTERTTRNLSKQTKNRST